MQSDSVGSGDDDRSVISIARTLAASSLGLTAPDLLSDDFIYSTPNESLDKENFLTSYGKTLQDIERAIPNYDDRPYSFTIDTSTADKVWFKIQPRGTISGPFSYRGEVYLPNDRNIEFPTQQLSATIKSGKVTY